MLSQTRIKLHRVVVSAVAASGLLLFSSLSTIASGKTERLGGIYDISIAGITVGRGSVSLIVQGNAYSAKVGMEPAGIGTLFSTGTGGAEATGWLSGKRILPARYTMASKAASRNFYVNLGQGSGHIRTAHVTPQFKPSKTRVKIRSDHRKNAMDPLSAALVPLPKGASTLGKEACNRTLPIFDGWTRFDIKLSFKGQRDVSGKGYNGPVVVCSARWVPVAGHRPERKAVKMLANAEGIEAWLAPVGDSGVLIPYRMTMPTATGTLVLQAQKLDMPKGRFTASR
ncbi:DUF3108 domain-containing protein [Polycladidibacter hongkongensis]|uniref:DUF3108 domain-containing protein n=1 Tax=Polycladidibacter hongkongensis TaxID=1647556 RepID=UPI000ADAA477|nr:DUF3108 domain-containing protein [Pseudovibrio hongkongensis]